MSRITLKNHADIEALRRAGGLVAETFRYLEPFVRPGASLLELDRLAEEFIRSKGAIPAYIGYRGFPNTICVAVNEGICHGIPSPYRLREGDIVGVDIGVQWDGYYGDACYTYTVGHVSPLARKLVDTTRECLEAAIKTVKPGSYIKDIGYAIQQMAESRGFSVVREYIGHGIGKKLHEQPDIPHWVPNSRSLNSTYNTRLKEGMVFTIEPMINAGHYATKLLSDEWTVVTADGSLSAQFEHTIAVTSKGADILTL
ncbi:type I methionyl aminopeptidase [Deinococcus roseus]|uniref:Methionine aminopeptidase n=1 Tax=Deinococcus roseus TaxID=392414 RepID=A0ABQ2CYV4_9DEIO|nr:type I methionyl aminopeptidase [Deinococcus roseus]GGJ29805.1 methionine aminopeptidase [Deinococcus roseus]